MRSEDYERPIDLAASLNAQPDRSVESSLFIGNERTGSPAVLVHAERAVTVHALEHHYLILYRYRNRELASGANADISQIASSAMRWVEGLGLEQLAAAYPFVKFTGLQLAYERGDAREYRWHALLRDIEESHQTYSELVALAYNSPVLRQFYPHLGHRFALSEDEYSDGVVVAVFFIRDGWFAVLRGEGRAPEFEGDASAMIAFLVQKVTAGQS